MATVKELMRMTQAAVDDDVDAINLIDWFNQCQDNIVDLLYLPTLKTISRDAVTGLFMLPADCNGELKILVPSGIDVYSIYDSAIYFIGHDSSTLDSIQITYNKIPVIVKNDMNQVPSIPVQFHDIYVFYGAMRWAAMEEETEKYELFEKDYLRMRGQLQKYMGKMRPKPSTWKVVR